MMHDIQFDIQDDATYATIYTNGDDPSFRFKFDSSEVLPWIESCRKEWLRAMKERESELDRRERLRVIQERLED